MASNKKIKRYDSMFRSRGERKLRFLKWIGALCAVALLFVLGWVVYDPIYEYLTNPPQHIGEPNSTQRARHRNHARRKARRPRGRASHRGRRRWLCPARYRQFICRPPCSRIRAGSTPPLPPLSGGAGYRAARPQGCRRHPALPQRVPAATRWELSRRCGGAIGADAEDQRCRFALWGADLRPARSAGGDVPKRVGGQIPEHRLQLVG